MYLTYPEDTGANERHGVARVSFCCVIISTAVFVVLVAEDLGDSSEKSKTKVIIVGGVAGGGLVRRPAAAPARERGYCMTIGGEKDIVNRLDRILKTLAPGMGVRSQELRHLIHE